MRSRLDPVEAMMSDGQVKDERGRREVMVLSASEDHLILHLHVSAFVSDSSRLCVNLYAVAKGRQERSELVDDLRRQQSTHLVRANGRQERSHLLHDPLVHGQAAREEEKPRMTVGPLTIRRPVSQSTLLTHVSS